MTAIYHFFLPLLQSFTMFFLAVLLGRVVERRWPLAKPPAAEYATDMKLSCLMVFLTWVFGPLAATAGALIVSLAGGGLITLRADGWWFVVSLVTIILTLEFFSYWIHRAQHAVPALWAMHSLHHSAESLTIVTGARHYWFENAVLNSLIPFMPILFKIPPVFITIIPFIYFLPDGCAHLNIRLQLGRFGLILNNPQYHRIHHSVQPEHRDKNFARMLPLFDILFGTVWRPERDEFPATGLSSSEKPGGLVDGLVWPLREWPPVRRVADALRAAGERLSRQMASARALSDLDAREGR